MSVDTTPPCTNLSIDGPPGENGWYVDEINISIIAIDNASGINITKYRLDGGEWQVYENRVTIWEDGEHTIEFYSVDNAGNNETVHTETVCIDASSPYTTYLLDPSQPDGNNGYYISNVTVILTSVDNISGCNRTYYRINDGEWQEYNGQFIISLDENYSIEFYSVDDAGNNETIKQINFRLDKTSPLTVVSTSGDGIGSWYRSDVSVLLNASDSTSGINGTYYRINEEDWNSYLMVFTISSEGEYTVEYYSADNAGNNETQKTSTFYIDKTPPSVDISYPGNGKVNDTISIQWTASDNMDDSPAITIQYRKGSGSWETLASNIANTGSYSWNTKNAENGAYYIKIIATDNAGNTGETISSPFTIDNPVTKPSVKITYPSNNANVSGVVIIQGTASDDVSVEKVEIRIDNGSWQEATGTTSWTYSWDTTSMTTGNYDIYVRSYDGTNYSDVVSITVGIFNNHKPTVEIIFPNDGMSVKKTFTIHGTASDEDGSETIQKVEIKIGDEEWKVVGGTTSWNYTWDSTTVDNGDYVIQARAYDGQEYSSIDSIMVKVNNEKSGGGGIPGFEMVALIVALGAVMWVKRRK